MTAEERNFTFTVAIYLNKFSCFTPADWIYYVNIQLNSLTINNLNMGSIGPLWDFVGTITKNI